MRMRSSTLAAALLVSGHALAQGTPVGGEFRVNATVFGNQKYPRVASSAAGDFVVVWSSQFQDGSLYGVFGQRYASSGAPLGSEFLVNTTTTQGQYSPAIASDSAGNFTVVWVSFQVSAGDVFGQRYSSTGAPLGGEFQVNTYTTGYQGFPVIASSATGDFVVVWASHQSGDPGYGVFGQRYSSTGAPLGGEFHANTYTTSDQSFPAVASDGAGDFVIVWQSLNQGGAGYGIIGQRYSSTGSQLGGEFQVITNSGGSRVASDAAGNFVVVWGNGDVFAQRYSSSGGALGTSFRVNTYTTNGQGLPAVASAGAGDFVVVWHSQAQTGDDAFLGIFGQRYSSTGAPAGGEFHVNTATTNDQETPAVASDGAGNFVVVWASAQLPTFDVFGQRYSKITPVELRTFAAE